MLAFDVTHQIKPGSTFESIASGGTCSTKEGLTFGTRCNPALFPYSPGEGIYISLISKADGDSIDNGRELIFKPISETLIRKLFEEKNFNSFTANTDIVFKTSLFEISYSPYYLLADLYIFNPAFPEISINLVNRETLKLSAGHEVFKTSLFGDDIYLSVGANLFYYEHQFSNTVFSLFDLSFQRPEELISFQSTYGLSSDIGFYLGNEQVYMPQFSLQFKNVGDDIEKNKSKALSSFQQDSRFLFETYTLFGIGKEISTAIGGFNIGYEMPIDGLLETPNPDLGIVGLSYSIRLASVFTSFGENYKNVGVRFDSENFNVGIIYTEEKDLGKISPSVEKSVYTGIDILL